MNESTYLILCSIIKEIENAIDNESPTRVKKLVFAMNFLLENVSSE